MSRYDVEYIKYYTGVDAKLVPSYSGFYMQESYNPIHNNYLIFKVAWSNRDDDFVDSVKKVKIKSFSFDVYSNYPKGL